MKKYKNCIYFKILKMGLGAETRVPKWPFTRVQRWPFTIQSSLVFPDGINVLSPFRIHKIVNLGFPTPHTALYLSFTVSKSSTFTQ